MPPKRSKPAHDPSSEEISGENKREKHTYSAHDTMILNELLNTLRGGKMRDLIETVAAHDKRHEMWKEVTTQFNLATGNELNIEQIRKKYYREKKKAREKRDSEALEKDARMDREAREREMRRNRVAIERGVRKDCALTGGGRAPIIPQDQDGDTVFDFQTEKVDNFPNQFGAFTPANGPRVPIVIADSENPTLTRVTMQDVFSAPVSEISDAYERIQPMAKASNQMRGPSIQSSPSLRTQASERILGGFSTHLPPVSSVESSFPANISFTQLSENEVHGPSHNSGRQAQSTFLQPPPESSLFSFYSGQHENQPTHQESLPGPNSRPNEEIMLLETHDSTVKKRTMVEPVFLSPQTASAQMKTTNTPKSGGGGKDKKEKLDKRRPLDSSKDEAATKFYKTTLSQRTVINKLSVNNLYMKGRILEHHLVQNGIPFELPYPEVRGILDSSSDSETDDF